MLSGVPSSAANLAAAGKAGRDGNSAVTLKGTGSMRRWFAVRPMAYRDADTRNPVNPLPARCSVEDEPPQLAFQIGLHVQ